VIWICVYGFVFMWYKPLARYGLGTVTNISVLNHSSDPNLIGSYTLQGMARICAIQLAAQFAALRDRATTELDYLTCKRTEMVSHGNNTM
jgi:hypothetical protein